MAYFVQHNLLSPCQHGFLKGTSLETAMLESVTDWSISIHCGHSVDVIYIDFQKAFDSVDHEKLIQKLEAYGITGHLLAWIKAFLTDRDQRVNVKGTLSQSKRVISGVPQGSILGPLLFVVFLNDVSEVINGVCVKMYADDVKLYADIDCSDSRTKLQEALNSLSQWSKTWQLTMSVPKCHVITLSNTRNPSDHHYLLNNLPLSRVKTVRDLGILVDTKLSFSDHYSALTVRACQRMNLLFRSICYADLESFVMAYKSYVRSILECATTVWSPSTDQDITKLESVQRQFTFRLLRKFNFPYMPYEMRCKVCALESLQFRRLRFDTIMTFKIMRGLINLKENQFFQRDRSGVNIRPFLGQNKLKNAFHCRAVNVYNKIPCHIRETFSLNRFLLYLKSEGFTSLLLI